jgi:hypothetical protein
MKFFFKILLFTWFINLNATPVFAKVVLPSYEFTVLKTENVKEESFLMECGLKIHTIVFESKYRDTTIF